MIVQTFNMLLVVYGFQMNLQQFAIIHVSRQGVQIKCELVLMEADGVTNFRRTSRKLYVGTTKAVQQDKTSCLPLCVAFSGEHIYTYLLLLPRVLFDRRTLIVEDSPRNMARCLYQHSRLLHVILCIISNYFYVLIRKCLQQLI